jgi:hypothetical protein
VSNGQDASTFKYLGLINTIVPNAWTPYSGMIGGVDTARNNSARFPYGTAFVRILFLPNWIAPGATDVIRFAGISFTDAIAESIPAGNFPGVMGFGVDPAARTTIGPGTIRLNTGATLNWQSSVVAVTLTGAATQTLTVAVPGATGIFVRANNARITGECTGTGSNNVSIHNPALLTGSVSLVLERYV